MKIVYDDVSIPFSLWWGISVYDTIYLYAKIFLNRIGDNVQTISLLQEGL